MKAAVLRTIPGQLSVEDVDIDNPGPVAALDVAPGAGAWEPRVDIITRWKDLT